MQFLKNLFGFGSKPKETKKENPPVRLIRNYPSSEGRSRSTSPESINSVFDDMLNPLNPLSPFNASNNQEDTIVNNHHTTVDHSPSHTDYSNHSSYNDYSSPASDSTYTSNDSYSSPSSDY